MDGCAGADELYDGAACGLLVTAGDGVILRVNCTFCAWVGREARELVNSTRLQDLLSIGGRIFHQTHWTPLLAMQGSVSEVKLEVPTTVRAAREDGPAHAPSAQRRASNINPEALRAA